MNQELLLSCVEMAANHMLQSIGAVDPRVLELIEQIKAQIPAVEAEDPAPQVANVPTDVTVDIIPSDGTVGQ